MSRGLRLLNLIVIIIALVPEFSLVIEIDLSLVQPPDYILWSFVLLLNFLSFDEV